MKRNGIKWAIMKNEFGFPVKDYYRPARPIVRAAYVESGLLAVLKATKAFERVLMEKMNVPRRVSALNR